MADETLAGHIAAMVEDGQDIPARDLAAVLDEVIADPDNAGDIIMLVNAPVRVSKSGRVNVMWPEKIALKRPLFFVRFALFFVSNSLSR
jgi:hypothetical protein